MRKALPFFVFLFAFLAAGPPSTQAQDVTVVPRIVVELWPDYDREALLVIITGGLPPATALPATVSLPFPADASLNVAARVTPGDVFIDDIDYTQTGDTLTLTTPDPGFRIEYYQPYTQTDDGRQIDFAWQAPFAVDQFAVIVQEPRAAAQFTLSQEPFEVQEHSDGLRYHILPVQRLGGGETYRLNLTYELAGGQLSRPLQVAPQSAAPTPQPTPATFTQRLLDNWILLALGSGLLLISLTFFFLSYRERAAQKPRKPSRARPAANFCHNCGEPLQKGDRFCRACGAAVKNA